MQHLWTSFHFRSTSRRETRYVKTSRPRVTLPGKITDHNNSQEGETQMAELQDKTEETKAKALSRSDNKHSVNRMANKLRKKRAHRRNLRKSNANG
jgi:hypothetical protein